MYLCALKPGRHSRDCQPEFLRQSHPKGLNLFEHSDMEMTIAIDRMRLYARHGVMAQERVVGNTFEVSARLTYTVNDNQPIGDTLEGTIDYGVMASVIRREMELPSQLLEHVAARIRRALLDEFPQVVSGEIMVAKLTPPLGEAMQSASATLAW